MVHPRARRRGRWWKGAWALLAAVTLLAATIAAGHRYFTCARMTGAALHACCEQGAADSEPSIDAAACCHESHFASPDQGFAQAPRGVMAAPVLALLPAPRLDASTLATASSDDIRSARAGPARASPNDHRIRLRVSLT